MRSRDRYVNLLTKAVMDLVAKGIRDPSVSEIAAEAFPNMIDPPGDPLDQPPGLGGEVYNGISKRLPKIRVELEDAEGQFAATVNSRYYQAGFRRAKNLTAAQAAIVLPGSGNKAVGIRVSTEGERDPVYLEWHRANGGPGASRVGRSSRAINKAHDNGVLTTTEGVGALNDFAERLGPDISEQINVLERRKPNRTALPAVE